MIAFGTKAETLERLRKQVLAAGAQVLPLIYFTVEDWRKNSCAVWRRIQEWNWEKISLILRSSALNEDTANQSMAGKYTSVADVRGEEAFQQAAKIVIDSYGAEVQAQDQVLVQPMLGNILWCGVAFTMDPNTGGHYYVINYDDSSGSTSSVTSGVGKHTRLFYCFKGEVPQDPKIRRLCDCLQRLERLFEREALDVEFAYTNEQKLYILQVRPLCMQVELTNKGEQARNLDLIAQKVQNETCSKPFLYGNRTIFGVMPDWNPAEMIGIRPKQLALSLYKEIITDSVWAYQRHNYGYRNLRSFPLMVDFHGLPYIDVRVSFNSFIPGKLAPELAEKLVNYYLDRLEENPQQHDKVEFSIVFSCYTIDLPQRIQILRQHGFTEDEVAAIMVALKDLTNQIVNSKTGIWRKDSEKIQILDQRREEILQSDLNTVDKIYWLLEDCKRYGTLPFAGLARAAFIAVQILHSLVRREYIAEQEYQDFLNDLNTISSMMKQDFEELSSKAFLHKYGHLRPGTYDITSPRYDEQPDLYFDWTQSRIKEPVGTEKRFRLTLPQFKSIRQALQLHGLDEDVLGLFDFIKFVIEGREYSKFVFTKNLSEILRLFAQLGEECGFSREECAFVDISIIKDLYQSSSDVKTVLEHSILQGIKKYGQTRKICLPPLITRAEQVRQFFIPDTEPTYVTLKKAVGPLVQVDQNTTEELKATILLIPSADPGFDWIFSHQIHGFITEYGGANSHMAIRAGELGIPAVIGVGMKVFEQLKLAQTVELDAAQRSIRVLK